MGFEDTLYSNSPLASRHSNFHHSSYVHSCKRNGTRIKFKCHYVELISHTRRISMIAGLCDKRITAPVIFEGTCERSV